VGESGVFSLFDWRLQIDGDRLKKLGTCGVFLVCLWSAVAGSAADAVEQVTTKQGPTCVVVLHGLARSPSSMSPVEKRLIQEGYQVVNQGYESTEYSIAELAVPTVEEALGHCTNQSTAHFVTHSMGGILLRQYAHEKGTARINRAVMLGPPNQGSETVDELGDLWMFELINGPAGRELSTAPDSVPNSLGPVEFELGVIAGTVSFNPLFSYWLQGDDDGKVSVTRARVEGMNAFRTVAENHTFIMSGEVVLDETVHFLAQGSFECVDQAVPPAEHEICETNR